MEQLYSPKQAAEKMSMCTVTVLRLMRANKIGHYKFNSRLVRISQKQIDEYVDSIEQFKVR